jgi:hypothetical protein
MLPGRVMGDLRRDRQFQGDGIPCVDLRAGSGGDLHMPGIYARLYALNRFENENVALGIHYHSGSDCLRSGPERYSS